MTTIEWTDETWNPVVGCSRVSAGCDHCYAMGVAHRFAGVNVAFAGLTKLRPKDASRPGVDWTGEVRTLPERLGEPLRWRKPRKVFVNSMSDLFHRDVPFEFIAAVFGVMAATPQHTFQVLTKRPERMFEFFRWLPASSSLAAVLNELWAYAIMNGIEHNEISRRFSGSLRWPLRNVHLGVSVEDHATADARIPLLLGAQSIAVRFVSYEPALGPVDFTNVGLPGFPHDRYDALRGLYRGGIEGHRLNWVIVGGESGPGARPFDIAWARRTVADCRAAGVPVFVKQLGALPIGDIAVECRLTDRKGGDWNEWPEDLRVREVPA